MSSQKLITSLRYQKKELLARVIPLFEESEMLLFFSRVMLGLERLF
jgi:hypothetical protein